MAIDKTIALAKGIHEDLKTKQWALRFDPIRTYRFVPELKNLDQLTVAVVLVGFTSAPDNRAEWLYEHTIDIGIQFRAKPDDGAATEKFDECMKLQSEIADFYRFQRQSAADMPLAAVELPNGAYVSEHMQQYNQFTGVVRLTFREWRDA